MVTKSSGYIDPSTIISQAPQQLAVQIPDERTLLTMLFSLAQKGLITQDLYSTFQLTNNGLLEYRKYIHPLWQISHDKEGYENILDKTYAGRKSKEDVKRILKIIKDLTIEQAYETLINFLKQAKNESVYLILQILSELAKSGNNPP